MWLNLVVPSFEVLEPRHLLSGPALTSPFQPPQHELYVYGGYLTTASWAEPLAIVRSYLSSHAGQFGVTSQEAANSVVTDEYSDSDTGLTHIYLQQTYEGLGIANCNLVANVMSDGRILSISGAFVSTAASGRSAGILASPVSNTPLLSAANALGFAATALGLTYSAAPAMLTMTLTGAAQAATFSGDSLSLNPIPSKLQYIETEQGLRLSWDFVIKPNDQHWYDLNVDSSNGNLVGTNDWVDQASYLVYPQPDKSPNDGSQVLVTEPVSTASPYGWHDTNGQAGPEYTDTRGNNVSAQADISGTETNEYRPDGGSTLTFNNPVNLSQDPSSNQAASVTNLYYWINLLHDIHYAYGFTEAAGDFQVTNYTGQGLGNDPVIADAQDGQSPDNASFATPPDGLSGQMQVGVMDATSPYRDLDLDNEVVIHEYGHGVSNRLVGGPSNVNALYDIQSEGMGEGWSDWWAMMLTQKATDAQMSSYPFCPYILGQSSSGQGIRLYPYSYDMAVDPLTYGRYNSDNECHDIGTIWASTLWDMNWVLINKYGFSSDISDGYHPGVAGQDAGNNLALQLVMDSLKIMPSNPTFLQGRNAILQADQALTGGANQLLIWRAFARRGMGFSAKDGGNANALAVTQAFDIPVPDPVIYSSAPNGKVNVPATYVTFNFSKPIDPASFSAASDVVSFTGPGGINLANQITGATWVDSQTLQVNFSAQTLNGIFTMVLGPQILAASDDHPMDQNTDGIPGEFPGDCYTATFEGVDTIYSANMDVNPGWTLDAGNGVYQWQYGVPTGGGSGDPTSGHTGSNVIGYNLTGDYPNSMSGTEYATTPTFSTADHNEVTLSLWRWLGVENSPYDKASIAVWDGISWTTVWSNDGAVYGGGETGNSATTINDGGWQLITYTLPATANDNPTVRIRFGMGPTDSSVTYCGWNIDDLMVTGVQIYQDVQGPSVISGTPWGPLKGSQSSATFIFSQPMDTTSFSVASDVTSFLGPRGDLKSQITGFSWLNCRELSVQFNTQSDPGSYSMVIGPGITSDAPGLNPMDQNNNGVNGEASGDCYALNFAILGQLYSANMDTDPHWTLDAGTSPYQWQWGVPTGGGASGYYDPTSGYTGADVMGFNLSGGYTNNMPTTQYAATPSFSTLGYQNLTLTFRRWLGVNAPKYDHANIQAWDGTSWTTLWQNAAALVDTSWQLESYTLPASAENKPDVRLRWGMGATGSSACYPGWNIDDVNVAGSYTGPYGVTDSLAVNEDSTANQLNVLTNDVHSRPLTITGVSAALHGTVTVINGGALLSYTPTPLYYGADTFTYNLADSLGVTDSSITVSITINRINHNPQVVADTATVYVNSSNNPVNVTANDSYWPDLPKTLTVTALTQPGHGTVTLTYGQVLYTPVAGYVGSDAFTYTLSDPYGGKATTSVAITVQDPLQPRLKVWLQATPVTSGDYSVQIWAQVVHGQTGQGISDLSITLYTPGTVGQTISEKPGASKYALTTWNPDVAANYLCVLPLASDYDGDTDLDAVQLCIGDTDSSMNSLGLQPILLATETWKLVSGTPTLAVVVGSSSRHWTATGGRAAFDSTEAQGAVVPLWTWGDVNHDNKVNAADIDAVTANFGAATGSQWKVDYDGTPVGQGDVTYLVKTLLHTSYGDANLDRKVDFADFQLLLDNWMRTSGWANGDFTGDHVTDFGDFQRILDNWNPNGSSDGSEQQVSQEAILASSVQPAAADPAVPTSSVPIAAVLPEPLPPPADVSTTLLALSPVAVASSQGQSAASVPAPVACVAEPPSITVQVVVDAQPKASAPQPDAVLAAAATSVPAITGSLGLAQARQTTFATAPSNWATGHTASPAGIVDDGTYVQLTGDDESAAPAWSSRQLKLRRIKVIKGLGKSGDLADVLTWKRP